MENFENKQSNNPNDEISIIDLFSVFIKYRKLIVFGTLIFSILIILVITIFNGNSAKKDDLYSVEFTIPFLINKNDVNTLIDYDFANDTVLKFKDVNSIANINKTCTRIQTIAHECVHSIQNRKLLMFNFIFSMLSFC